MIHRFQTRLTVSVSVVVALTVVGMTSLIVIFAANNIVQQDREKAILLHRLLQNSIENVTELPANSGERSRQPPRLRNSAQERGPLPNPLQPDLASTNNSQRSVRRFGIGRRSDLHVILPGRRTPAQRSNRLVQGIADCFVVDTAIEKILVVQGDGRIAATAAVDGSAPGPADDEITALCQKFLQDEFTPFQIEVFGSHVGVITPLKDPASEQSRALYVQYHKASPMELLGYRLVYVILLGIGMIIIGILISINLSRKMAKPVYELASDVREFGNGNLTHRIDLKTDDEFRMLGSAFNHMAGSIQAYTKKLEVETKRREGLESELRIAADLQRSLLPEKSPQIKGLDLAGWSQPAAQVGGDFFDYIELGENRVCVMIGDATGKGLPAALLTNECWSMLAAFSQGATSPADLLSKTNNALCRRLGNSGQFVTLFLMLIDIPNARMQYSVAGHNPPLFVGFNPSREKLLTSRHGFPLGLFKDCKFEDVDLALNPADTILLYSDGLTDAPGPCNGRYGDKRLRSSLNETAQKPMPDLITCIRRDLDAHTGGTEIRDDITIVGVRFSKDQEK